MSPSTASKTRNSAKASKSTGPSSPPSLSFFLQTLFPLTTFHTHSSWPTIPQLYIGGEFIGGCDIALQMHQNGELEKLLVEKGLVEAEGTAEPGAEA